MIDLVQKFSSLSRERRGQLLEEFSRRGSEFSLFPLSFAQERLWFLDQLEPNSTFYNLTGLLRLTGKLRLDALHGSLNEIVRRHEILRTSFISLDGQQFQWVREDAAITLPLVELEGVEDARQAMVQLIAQEVQCPFDLAQDRLLRAKLLRIGAHEHLLLLTIHHIVCDGWSLDVFMRELATIYASYVKGEEPSLDELPIQYADYAAWQREWLTGETLAGQLSYWRGQLAGAPALIELATDRPRTAVQTFRGATRKFELEAELSQGLRELSRRENVTLFMTLLAAFQTLLFRYTDQEDIVVGTPVANRDQAEVEGLIGLFVNTLALRTNFGGDPSFKDLLARVRHVCLGAYAHQEMPFEGLVKELQPERSMSHNPLFQIAFALQTVEQSAIHLAELKIERVRVESDTAKFDLTLEIEETPRGLLGRIEYNTDLFNAHRVERMVENYRTILRGVVSESDRRVSQLPLLTTTEQQQLLTEWNSTRSSFDTHTCVHTLFERQARETPDNVAVADDKQQLSYRELNERANQLAHRLRKMNVGPDTLAGIYMERGVEMIVGVLGILKAGGAYVPLDPANPPERTAFMVRDARLRVLVTQQHLAGVLTNHDAETLSLDSEAASLDAESVENPLCVTDPENLAYVIYTSGSTGLPKGVELQHVGLVNLIRWHQSAYTINASDRATQLAALSFDASVWELWPYLTSGASIHIAGDATRSSTDLLLDWLQENAITACFLPTVLLEAVLDEPRFAELPLRVLLTGGDRLHRGPTSELPFKIVNHYGPTENTVVTTSAFVTPFDASTPPPIGKPISNTRVYILDSNFEPVPVGVPGELHVGGVGLARGYLHRAPLTAEKFVPDPFGEEEGGRLYRAGDRVRYLENGDIEFLGRLDHQVKVRGFRIELGEIEATLNHHPAVQESIVVAREGVSGEMRLLAYCVPASEHEIDARELHRFLGERLPAYMLPAAFVSLAEFPLTPNGKVDHRVLPEPEETLKSTGGILESQTPVEEIVGGIWRELLGVRSVSLDDNFFESGGHSLLATQFVSRVRDALHVELPVRQLFESPTLASLCERVEAAMQSEAVKCRPPIAEVPRGDTIPLSFAQQRLWFLQQLEPEIGAYNIAAAVRLEGPLDVTSLERSFDEVSRRHEALRTTFQIIADVPVQVVTEARPLKIPLQDLSPQSESEQKNIVDDLAVAEARKPFDLAHGPLVRIRLLRLGEAAHVLLLTVHHIVADGWSMGVFIREIGALYEAYRSGTEPQLAELPVQYADFAAWQRGWLQGEVLDEQLSYWKSQMSGVPPLLNLPTDRPRMPVQTFRGASQAFVLSRETSERLAAFSRREHATLFMTLLAAFKVLLHRYSGQAAVVVGTPIANRGQAELEPLIGLFANTLLLPTKLDAGETFARHLWRVRENALGAYAHQDMPFEKLVEELQPERNFSYNPLFQVMFSFQKSLLQGVELPGLRLSPIKIDLLTARFDLTLDLEDTEVGVNGNFEYNTDLFDAGTVMRMIAHYQNLLAGILKDPHQSVAMLPLLSEAERQQLLTEWNQTERDFSARLCVHHLFETQAARDPEAIAVVCGSQRLSYRQLHERSNQLAHYLRRMKVDAEVLVGILLERSLEMVVGVLGILKAGGAYLPLDPMYPAERLSYMLEDSRVSVLVTQEKFRAENSAQQRHQIFLDSDWETISLESSRDIETDVDSANLAYVIYTSGSTGRPKGTQITHRSVVNFLEAMRERPGLSSTDALLSVTTLSFDISNLEIFLPLATGARLIIAEHKTVVDGAQLKKELAATAATVMQATPATWRLLREANWPGRPDLKILCGGEALTRELAEYLLDHGDSVWNLYGPTETTIWSTVHQIQSGDGPVAIGRPIANTRIYLLDEHFQPVPLGVAGDLYIGGEGIARGYLHRPELTAERFVPDLHSGEAGARMYRTGDVARYLPSGDIQYLNRGDNQVKIRGHRVELEEIEAALEAHPAIKQAAVVARGGSSGVETLDAYAVLCDAQSISSGELRDHLANKLPAYMLPSSYTFLDTMPLTLNGKVDRKALPAPETKRDSKESPFVEPQTRMESTIAAVWQEAFDVARLGVNDNFFDLGGHSLLMARVQNKLQITLNREIPMIELFNYPTVASLAKFLSSGAATTAFDDQTTEQLNELKKGKSRLQKRFLQSRQANKMIGDRQ